MKSLRWQQTLDFMRFPFSYILPEQVRNQTQPSCEMTLSTAAATVISSCIEHCTLFNSTSTLSTYPVPQPGSAPYPTNQSAPYPSQQAPYPTQAITNPTALYPSGQSAPYPSQPTGPTGPQTTN